MLIRNIRADTFEIPEAGNAAVAAGDTIEVDDDLGKRLILQEDAWQKVTAKRTTRERD